MQCPIKQHIASKMESCRAAKGETAKTANLAAVLHAAKGDFTVEERPIPVPGPGEVLIRNRTVAVNPMDWKRWAFGMAIPSYPAVLGQDVSGIVAAVGPNVNDNDDKFNTGNLNALKSGDRVVGFAAGLATHNLDHGAFQTYTIARVNATARIPDAMPFAAAVTLISGVSTAAMCLYDVLGVPLPNLVPNAQSQSHQSILVWGGASAVGSAAIQLARLSGFTVLATASAQHHARLRSLGADAVVDYTSSGSVVDDLVAAARGIGAPPVVLAIDAISKPHTLGPVVEVLTRLRGDVTAAQKLAHTGPWPAEVARGDGMETGWVRADELWTRRRDLCGWLYNEALPKWLGTGAVVPGAYRIVGGGVGGIQGALTEVMKGVSGEKLVVEV